MKQAEWEAQKRMKEEALAEVKRLREVIDKEHPTFDWSSRQTIANLDAEVKRLRRVIYDALYVLQTDGWNKNRADAINRLEKVLIKGWEGEEE